MHGLTSIIFGIVALGPAFLALLLPDPSKVALPDDVNDAERLGEEETQESQWTDRRSEITQKRDSIIACQR